MKKVLIIDSSPTALWLAEKIISEEYKVIQFTGLEAWCYLSEGNTCDLIISDTADHDTELLENIRNSGLLHDIPFIMLSGFGKLANCT